MKTEKELKYNRPQIIVSFTTIPERVETLHHTLESIYSQTMPADKVILWLSQEQFLRKENSLPQSLLNYKKKGLEIRWCAENIRSHKKYFYVMQEYPDAIVITIDDDLIYESYMIEALYASYLHFPNAVSTVRTHLILPDSEGNITDYSLWVQEFSGVIGIPSMQLFATSGAGTLYPPHCMDEAVFDIEKIIQMIPYADDIWLKIMQVRNNTPVVLVYSNKKLKYVPRTQSTGLYQINVHNNANQYQMEEVLKEFDKEGIIVSEILSDKFTAESNATGVNVILENDYSLLDEDVKVKYINTLEEEIRVYISENKKLKCRISEAENYNILLKQQREERDKKIKELYESKNKYVKNNEDLKLNIENHKVKLNTITSQLKTTIIQLEELQYRFDNESLFSFLKRFFKRFLKEERND